MNLHHIPEVNDEHLERIINQAKSPVAVLFRGVDSILARDRSELLLRRLGKLAEDWDDKVIFLDILVDENPTPETTHRIYEPPVIVIFHRGREFGRCDKADRESIEELIRRADKARR